MELLLQRDARTEKSTTGKLSVDGVFECYTLEDKDRGLISSMPLEEIMSKKVYGQTAIPTGRYEVTISYSPKFQRMMPLLNGVPGYDEVRIHPGNSNVDTLGCLLVGHERSADWISDSRIAFNNLWPKIDSVIDKGGKVFITIQ